jgi:hypothetical protein
VTYKAAAERLTVPAGCAVEWFGNIRGIDRYKNFDTVIIAGRQQLPVDAVEARARALFADDPEPLNLTGELVEQDRGYRLRDGGHVCARVWVHLDPRVQAMIEQVRERETAQAIDRLRLIHRNRPARVIVLSNLVLDLTVDRLVTWREIIPSRLEQAAARGPAVPLSASELARCFPDLWPTVKTARREQDICPISHIIELLGKRGIYLNARYKRGKQKRPTPALIRSDAPNPRAALEFVVGPVDWFEVEETAEPVIDPVIEEVEPEPQAAEAAPVNTLVSQIDADPADPAGSVVPIRPPEQEFPPSAVQELHRLQRIVSAAGRLADLSGRLERARPPPDLARRVERVAVLQ